MFSNLFESLNHLPVTSIAESVAEHFVNQMIPVVTSEVASGKTMLIPAHCAELLNDDPTDNVVYVLEPTRFLANNAAESLRSLLGKDQENRVGCINSNRSDDDSVLHSDNRIIFTTVGYALSAGILKNKNNFILDEAHETSIDLSLAKAYLHHRLEQGDLINMAILSATIDIENEMTYWGDNAVHFTTEGSAFPVEYLHRPAFSLTEAVVEMIQQYNRKGILVFVSGVEEIDEAVTSISEHLRHQRLDFEIMSVHGNTNGEQRRYASAQPNASIKILVGTNVLESGISLSWVDAGVSSGDTKVMHVNGNVRRLNKEELPRWRIHQQMGRVARFQPGVFILAHHTPLERRPEMSAPDIARLPLTELVMHCTILPDIRIHDLKFTSREQPKPGEVDKAIQLLVQYGLITEMTDGSVTLTDEGRLIQPLPLSYRAAVAYCEAHRINKLAELLPLIAMLDMGDLRFDYRSTMIGSNWKNSDPVHQVMTIAQYFHDQKLGRQELREEAESRNVNLKKLQEYTALLKDLEKKTGTRAKFSWFYHNTDEEAHAEVDRFTKQVIFRSMITEIYTPSMSLMDVRIPMTEQGNQLFSSAKISNTTICEISHRPMVLMCAGSVRIINPKVGVPFAVLEGITTFVESDMKFLLERFGKPVFQKIANISTYPTALNEWLTAGTRFTSGYNPDSFGYSGGRRTFRPMRDFLYHDFDDVPPEPAVETPEQGLLGDLLQAAFNKK